MYSYADKDSKQKDHFGDIIGKDNRMQELYDLITTISPTFTTVLILGETGTGKELVARAIHQNSQRKYKSFIKIDCTALPETLIESELFGYKKGAFTDARTNKPGKFEMAEGGTIFLDEIGEIPISTQAKLLRVLEERVFEPLGSVKMVKLDVRIIAATNKNLQKAIRQGYFREDLYYRLNIFTINVPKLRDRPSDIPLLVKHFVRTCEYIYSKDIKMVSQDALDLLMSYPWPGNVRQLRYAIEYAFINCKGNAIQLQHLPEEIKQRTNILVEEILERENPIKEIEREVIVKTLKRCNQHQGKTAKALNISRTTLWRKMKKYEIK